MTREIIADVIDHVVGEREIVDWTRPDGQRYRDVRVMFLRKVTREDYLEQFPHMRERLTRETKRCFFWEVSVD